MLCGRTAFWPALGCPAGTSDGLPQARATLPSVSNSMTGGDALDLNGPPRVPLFVSAPPTPSGEARPPVWKPRVTMMRWSCESMQVPPGSPVTQLSGSGFGQNGSTLNVGATSRFSAFDGPATGSMLTRPMPTARPRPMVPANAYRLFAMTPPSWWSEPAVDGAV